MQNSSDSGIYRIESLSHPERIYIGSTVNFHARFKIHISTLNKQKHPSKKLQYHFNKYGLEDLKFSIIKKCSKENLLKEEQVFLNNLPYFNTCKIAGSQLGLKRSEKTKQLMREIHAIRRIKKPPKNKEPKQIEFICFNCSKDYTIDAEHSDKKFCCSKCKKHYYYIKGVKKNKKN